MKATSIFGGVQIFNIIISIIRSKFIAVLLGPAGIGISGLLTSTTGLISGLTNFGLGTSAVRNIAAANKSDNDVQISRISKVLSRLVWVTGLLGTLITLLCAPWLSELTFGNDHYTTAFIWISITLLFNQLTSGQLVLLQGMRKLQYLAKANLLGSAIGLILTVPLYYRFGINGIVPGLILSSIVAFSLSAYFRNKIKIKPIKVSYERTIAESRNMLTMGFMISMSGLITIGSSYLVRIYISHHGGIDQVGLYNAGFAIINTYVGLIFTAMATDYYPRLSAVATSNIKSNQVINQQAEISLLILSPVLIFFLVFIKWMIILLYSERFIAVNQMIYWAALGMFFKAVSWSIAFIFLAKGASKLFFWNELLTNLYLLLFNLIGYKYCGLTGLGVSFLISFIIYMFQVYTISSKKYNISFTSDFYKIFGIQIMLAITSFIVIKILKSPYTYIIGSFIFITSVYYSYKELNKRLNFKTIFASIQRRIN